MGCDVLVTLKSVPLCALVTNGLKSDAEAATSHMKPSPYERKMLAAKQAARPSVRCEGRGYKIVWNTCSGGKVIRFERNAPLY